MPLRLLTRPLKKFKQLKRLLPIGTPIEVERSRKRYLEEMGWELSTSTSPREWQGYYRTRNLGFDHRVGHFRPLSTSPH